MLGRNFDGEIVDMFTNCEQVYDGDLSHYFRVIIKAPNISHGYHNLRHMLYVTWVCYQACNYYKSLGRMNGREARNLLIAAMFHDYGHCGTAGDDALNIKVALEGLNVHISEVDKDHFAEISRIIRATQFPHADLGDSPTLGEQVIRDADISQTFGTNWIGDIVTGFGSELEMTPVEILEQQLVFLREHVKFCSDFGTIFFGQKAVKEKYDKTNELLLILRE